MLQGDGAAGDSHEAQGLQTMHDKFKLVCLNIAMLQLAYFELRDMGFFMHRDVHR